MRDRESGDEASVGRAIQRGGRRDKRGMRDRERGDEASVGREGGVSTVIQ
jgi:hypothetical protein